MKYLVPYDFTPITRAALNHAFAISRQQPGQIELLHIIAEEKQRQDAENRFKKLLAELNEADQAITECQVRLGDIFHDISKEAEEGGARLLIMGTHGAKGLQKILGSHALKVITSSKTPFIVTQSKSPEKSIEKIVLPVDLSKESVQVVGFAASLARSFKAQVDLVCKPQKDEFLSKKLSNNILKARRYLHQHEIAYELHTLPGKHSLSREVMEYGESMRADLFAIAHFPESILPQFDRFSQELITNKAEIPVLIVNASQVGDVQANYSFISI